MDAAVGGRREEEESEMEMEEERERETERGRGNGRGRGRGREWGLVSRFEGLGSRVWGSSLVFRVWGLLRSLL